MILHRRVRTYFWAPLVSRARTLGPARRFLLSLAGLWVALGLPATFAAAAVVWGEVEWLTTGRVMGPVIALAVWLALVSVATLLSAPEQAPRRLRRERPYARS